MQELENGFTRKKSAVGSEITTARTKMTANELKVFYQVSTLIDKDDGDFKEYTISVKDFCSSLGLNDSNRDYIVGLCKKLLRQVFEIEQEDGDYLGYTIFSKMHYKHKKQEITMGFNDEMRPYLLNLKNFTKIENVEYIKQFESKYAIRIYALLKDYRKMTYRDIEIEALHKMLQLPKSYQNFGILKQKVLDPAIGEINEKSDLYISKIEEIKKERKKVLKIRIHFDNKAEKIANDKIKFLLEYYYNNRGHFHFDSFKGLYYINPHATQKRFKDLKKITSIEIDQTTKYHQLFCDNQDNAVLGSPNARDFLRSLCMGIYEAILIYYENDKKQRLDFGDWQVEQDEKKAQEQRIEEYKEILREWLGAKKDE